jgi:hypothetical protein
LPLLLRNSMNTTILSSLLVPTSSLLYLSHASLICLYESVMAARAARFCLASLSYDLRALAGHLNASSIFTMSPWAHSVRLLPAIDPAPAEAVSFSRAE